MTLIVVALMLLTGAVAGASQDIPSFSATALTGRSVTTADLLGQPTVLILTPSRDAAGDTRKWAQALRAHLANQVRVRDVIAIDLPFFTSESDALGRAKERIPARYYDQTWLMTSNSLESALGVPPSSHSAFVFVLSAEGQVIAKVGGEPTKARMARLRSALDSLR